MVFDDFFKDPHQAKAAIQALPMQDERYSDGVIYPNITRLPVAVALEVKSNLETVFGPRLQHVLSFARYSFKGVTPPHWAHSDRNIAQFLGLIYLNEGGDDYGTSVVRHKAMGFEDHPRTEEHKEVLLAHANKRDEWEVTFTCPARFNRLFLLNAELVHASMGEFGSSKEDGRLVISTFFNVAAP
jgi:hypothetical protein